VFNPPTRLGLPALNLHAQAEAATEPGAVSVVDPAGPTPTVPEPSGPRAAAEGGNHLPGDMNPPERFSPGPHAVSGGAPARRRTS
jgi:hypothetical protein